jgi:L-serine/L-threonine ammonia-lyase
MPLHVVTPLVDSTPLARVLGARVGLKLESLQPTGSFKIRGVGRACENAVRTGAKRFVSSSGGNAGLAVAWAGRMLGVPTTVFVPRSTSERMIAKIRAEDAVVEVRGEAWDDAHAAALAACEREPAFYVHPFDSRDVWAGNSTLIDEVVEQGLERPDAVVVAVGGGGLLCGVLEGMHRVGWNSVPVVAVETRGAASLRAAIQTGMPVDIGRIDTIATTLGARQVCARAVLWTKQHPIVSWLVPDRAAVDACLRFADDHRVLVEPACGAALAVVYGRADPIANLGSVLVVVCGGAGVTPHQLTQWDAEV